MDLLRQWKLFNPDDAPSVSVIGVGSIGSPVVFLLAKMGLPVIKVWDFDVIESHNQPNQLYRSKDIGRPKVEALAEIVEEFSDTKIEAINGAYDAKPPTQVVISGVDNMKARKQIFEDHIEMSPRIERYWDCRMGGEMVSIYSMKPTNVDDIEGYKDTLFSDEEGVDLPCGEKSIMYTNMWIASFIAKQIQCYSMGLSYYKKADFSWQPHMFSGVNVEETSMNHMSTRKI